MGRKGKSGKQATSAKKQVDDENSSQEDKTQRDKTREQRHVAAEAEVSALKTSQRARGSRRPTKSADDAEQQKPADKEEKAP